MGAKVSFFHVTEPGRLPKSRQDLGIPDEVRTASAAILGLGGRIYYHRIIGVVIDDLSRRYGFPHPRQAPALEFSQTHNEATEKTLVAVWRWRITVGPYPACLEGLWIPGREPTITMRNIEHQKPVPLFTRPDAHLRALRILANAYPIMDDADQPTKVRGKRIAPTWREEAAKARKLRDDGWSWSIIRKHHVRRSQHTILKYIAALEAEEAEARDRAL